MSYEPLTAEFPSPAPVSLIVRNAVGRVSITAVETRASNVEIMPDSADGAELAARTRVTFDPERSRLTIDVPERKSGRQAALDIGVRLPELSAIEIATVTADVLATGPLSEVEVRTASGDVVLPSVTGPCTVSTASGDARVDRVGGPLEVRTASGDVSVGSATGASLSTASGDLDITEITGDLRARSASGDVLIGTAGAGKIEARTMSGDVLIGVRRGLLLWIDATSMSGEVQSRLDPDAGGGTGADASDLENDGEPDLAITASSTSGDVLIRRAR